MTNPHKIGFQNKVIKGAFIKRKIQIVVLKKENRESWKEANKQYLLKVVIIED